MMDIEQLKKEVNGSLADIDVCRILVKRLKKRGDTFRDREVQALQNLLNYAIELNTLKIKEAKNET